MEADLVLLNANLLSKVEGDSLAIYGGRIIKIGRKEDIYHLIGPKTKVIDLRGKTVLPGFVDAHIHLSLFGLSLNQIDLRGVRSIEELKTRVKEEAERIKRGEWIIGRGWDQELLEEKRYPTRWDLDEVSPDNPVLLMRVCGHVGVVNSKALELASITKDTKVQRGVIDRDESGEPIGILREEAIELVQRVIPPPTLEKLKNSLEQAIEEAVRRGLTSVHCICSDRFPDELRALQLLRREGKLLLRVYLIPPFSFMDKLRDLGLMTGFGDSMLRIGGVKIFTDGSLGGRTAALEEPYADMPGERGILIHSPEELKEIVLEAHKAGFQAVIHAIGDRAVKVALDAIEFALAKEPKAHRHRIEHASVLNPHLISRMKELGVVAVCQPHFIYSDFWAEDRVGLDRAKWVYALKSLKENVVVAGSSDCPVEPLDPLRGIWAAVVRPNLTKDEKLSVKDAIEIYTMGGAYASFEEKEKGSIEEGKLADLVVLSEDPRSVPLDRIKDIRVEMTIVDGRIMFMNE